MPYHQMSTQPLSRDDALRAITRAAREVATRDLTQEERFGINMLIRRLVLQKDKENRNSRLGIWLEPSQAVFTFTNVQGDHEITRNPPERVFDRLLEIYSEEE